MAKQWGPWATTSPLSVFVNKILLGHSRAHLLCVLPGVSSLALQVTEVSHCDRDHMARKPQILVSLPLAGTVCRTLLRMYQPPPSPPFDLGLDDVHVKLYTEILPG